MRHGGGRKHRHCHLFNCHPRTCCEGPWVDQAPGLEMGPRDKPEGDNRVYGLTSAHPGVREEELLAVLLIAGDRRLPLVGEHPVDRSEEHTSELQSLMRKSYAVFCLKKK